MNTTRQSIVEAADSLFYSQGFEHTSFSDVADAVGISRGNFYYHFKTKDEILQAVIQARLDDRQSMLAQWELDSDSPEDRIRSFINIVIVNRAKIKKYGCPIGTLCTELEKLDHPMRSNARALFTLFRTWLHRQFNLLGCKLNSDALAMHVLAHSQGVATMANTFHDDGFVRSEVEHISEWLSSIVKDTQNTQRN